MEPGANVRYVTMNGNDANPGTSDSEPKQSVLAAYDDLYPLGGGEDRGDRKCQGLHKALPYRCRHGFFRCESSGVCNLRDDWSLLRQSVGNQAPGGCRRRVYRRERQCEHARMSYYG